MFLYSRLSTRTPEVLATLLIFSLSSGVLGGILFYMDSTAPTVLSDMTSQVPIDMQVSFSYPFYFQDNTTVEDVRAIVDQQDYVVNTEIVTLAQFYDWSEEDYIYSRKAFLGVNQTALETFPAAIEFDSGSNDFDDNSCIVERSTFMRYGLEIGGNFTLSFNLWDENYTMVVVERDFLVVGTFTSHIYMHTPIWGQPETTYLQMITTQSAVQTMFDLLPPDEYEGLTDRIWVGFDKESILETDAQLMIESLDSVKKRIEQATLPYALIGYNDFQLLEAVNEFALWSISVRSIALAFSLPSVIMGIMLIQYNTKLLSDEQRRDVGTLKTRGASGFQAFNWVMSSAIVTGIIGSLGAIATGIISAFVSGSVRELLVFLPEQLEGFTLLLQPIAIIVVFLFSFLAGIIITLPGAIKALIMTPTEAHGVLEGEVLSEVEKMGSPSIDIISLAVAAFLLGPMMSFAAMYGLNAVGLIIVPLFALLLFSFSRILARPTSRIKSWVLSRFHGRSVVVGSRLISRNVTMFKKSETMGTMFIAMVFLAGLFASMSATTGDTHMKSLFYFQTGADIIVDVNFELDNVTIDLAQNITAVDGVAQVSPVWQTVGYVQYFQASYMGAGENVNRSIAVYGIEPETWASTAFFLDYFTMQFSPAVAIALLSMSTEDNTNVITSFKPIDSWLVDSVTGIQTPVYSPYIDLQIFSDTWHNESECTIVDVMTNSLGSSWTRQTYLPGEPDASDFVIMDLNLLHEWTNMTKVTKFYVDLQPGANYTQAMTDIYNIAPDSFSNVEAAQESIDTVLDSRATQSIYGAYTLNVIFSLIYLTIGIVIVTTVRVRVLRKQFSVLRALGTNSKSIVFGAIMDTSVGLALGALIGGGIGAAMAFLLQSFPLLYMGITTTRLWSRLPVHLIIPWNLVFAIVGIAVAVSLIATYIVLSRTLNLNIAEEIQYTE